jgi:hypothetical protein
VQGGEADKILPNPIRGGQEINKSLSNNNKFNIYLATKNAARSEPIPNLFGGGSKVLKNVGDLIDFNDKRSESLSLESNLSTGTNVSYSFDPSNMSCACCGKFLVGPKVGRQTQIWVLTDQNFPPSIPNLNGKQCMKIVRFENGNLLTMVNKFLFKYATAIGGKDVVSIGSASQLLREGVEGMWGPSWRQWTALSLGPGRTAWSCQLPLF